MTESSYDCGWAVAEHLPAVDEYWGEDALVHEPTSEQKKGAVAPSVAAGNKKFAGLLSRDSSESVCNVAFRAPRAIVKINGAVLPAGFPSVVDFWRGAKSKRMFTWGLRKWHAVFPGAAWVAPMIGSGFSSCAAGRLRRAVVVDSNGRPVTSAQVRIVRGLVRCGVIRCADRAASAFLRIKINLARWQRAAMRCLFLVRLRRCLGRKRRRVTAVRPSGRESPSLKRARE